MGRHGMEEFPSSESPQLEKELEKVERELTRGDEIKNAHRKPRAGTITAKSQESIIKFGLTRQEVAERFGKVALGRMDG